jgi:hypothetical protein
VPVVTRVRALTFSTGQRVEVPDAGVVVLVGPNNSGKSAALRETYHHLTGHQWPPGQPPRVVPAIEAQKEGSEEEFREWLETNTHAFTQRSTGQRQYGRPNVRLSWEQARNEWLARPDVFGPSLTALFVLQAHTEQRLGLLGGASYWNPFEEGPSAPLQMLFASPELEQRLSEMSVEAFDQPLHVSRLPGAPIELYVGAPEVPPSITSVDENYVEALRSMPLVAQQGDGMRSFVGIMLALVAATYPTILIDEPEAFLHPPQARLLGRKIATESRETQVIVATHSTHVLFGLLSGGAEDVTVVRVTRENDTNPIAVLPPGEIAQLWSDPLLASSNLLDGLFHRGVVVCEGDTDARYYAAVLEAERGDRAHELFLTHCGGKARIPMVVRALRALDVPVVVVADFDLLRERERISDAVHALGGTWGDYERDWTVLNAAVGSLGAAPAIEDARQAIDEALVEAAGSGPRLSREASARIRAATKVADGWSVLKESGLAAVPRGDPSTAASDLLARLREIGLFLVPVGEIEAWHREVSRESSAWLADVLEERLHERAGPHREFVADVGRWFDPS